MTLISLLFLSSYCFMGVSPQMVLHCDAGWDLFGCHCYQSSTEMSTWDDARRQCTDVGADLVSVHSQPELDFISDKVEDRLWIGLTDNLVEGQWGWSDGSDMTFTSWFPHQPNNGLNVIEDEDCAEMGLSIAYDNIGWDDVPCELHMKYICKKHADFSGIRSPEIVADQKDVTLKWNEGTECLSHMEIWEETDNENQKGMVRQWIFDKTAHPEDGYVVTIHGLQPSHKYQIHIRVVTDVSSVEGNLVETLEIITQSSHSEIDGHSSTQEEACPVECECEEGWSLWMCSCYKLTTQALEWVEAEARCEREQADQVAIHSQEEQDFITGLADDHLWVGLTRNEEYQWSWSDGSTLDFEHWHSEEEEETEEEEVEEEVEGSGSGSGDGDFDLYPYPYYYSNMDRYDYYIDIDGYSKHGSDTDDTEVDREKECVENTKRLRENDFVTRWTPVPCELRRYFICKKPANIKSTNLPEVSTGSHPEVAGGVSVQLHWPTLNLCNANFNVTHAENGVSLSSESNEKGHLFVHYYMSESDTGVVHQLHVSAGLHPQSSESNSVSVLVKAVNYSK